MRFPRPRLPVTIRALLFWSTDRLRIGRDYDAVIKYFAIIGGQPLYGAMRNGKSLVVYGDKEIGTEYDSVQDFRNFGGKTAYIAWKDGKTFIVYDGSKTAEGYDFLEFLTDATQLTSLI